jgi:RimJ/RimL family protein N-acetyltransferase
VTAPVRAEPIGTGRLELLPLRVEDADEMAAVLSDPALYTFIGGAPETAPELRARYTRMVGGSPEPGVVWCNWVIRLRADGCLAGTVQATVSGSGAEIAWMVGTAWQGRGIATEAAQGMLRDLEARGVRTFVAHIAPGHAASAAVARALGLTPTEEWNDGEVRWRRPALER